MDTSTNQSGANWLQSCTFIERFKFCTKIKLYMMCGASVSGIDSFTVLRQKLRSRHPRQRRRQAGGVVAEAEWVGPTRSWRP